MLCAHDGAIVGNVQCNDRRIDCHLCRSVLCVITPDSFPTFLSSKMPKKHVICNLASVHLLTICVANSTNVNKMFVHMAQSWRTGAHVFLSDFLSIPIVWEVVHVAFWLCTNLRVYKWGLGHFWTLGLSWTLFWRTFACWSPSSLLSVFCPWCHMMMCFTCVRLPSSFSFLVLFCCLFLFSTPPPTTLCVSPMFLRFCPSASSSAFVFFFFCESVLFIKLSF